MRTGDRLTCLIISVFALCLPGCSTVSFEHRFGTPVDDETLARFDGVWEVGDDSNVVMFVSRGSGWIEMIGFKQLSKGEGKGGGDAVGPDKPPKSSVRLDQPVFVQIREFDDSYYAWFADTENAGRTVYIPVKIASPGGRDLADDELLLAWAPNVDRFEKSAENGELAGTVKGYNGKTIFISSKPADLERFVIKAELHEWIVLDEPVVIKRLTRQKQ